jgi:hypothetical protein
VALGPAGASGDEAGAVDDRLQVRVGEPGVDPVTGA